jgi:hypothetical protein
MQMQCLQSADGQADELQLIVSEGNIFCSWISYVIASLWKYKSKKKKKKPQFVFVFDTAEDSSIFITNDC